MTSGRSWTPPDPSGQLWWGFSEGGPMSMLFAASHPERTTALVLEDSFARLAWAPDYPWGMTPQTAEGLRDTHPQVMGRWHLHFSVLSERQGRCSCQRAIPPPGAILGYARRGGRHRRDDPRDRRP